MTFEESLYKHVKDSVMRVQILNAPYLRRADDPGQDTANRFAAMLDQAEKLLPYDLLANVMFDRACCKTGSRLLAAKAIAKDNPDASALQRLVMLGNTLYMGKPFINGDGDIQTVAVSIYGSRGACPCWQLKGRAPEGRPMPLAYCMCCAGHFRFHYEKALGYKLRLKRVVSSLLASGGTEPCVFIYEKADI
jgi:hypothetical protein